MNTSNHNSDGGMFRKCLAKNYEIHQTLPYSQDLEEAGQSLFGTGNCEYGAVDRKRTLESCGIEI